jgi:putative membrane protein, TIGR04086 family/integral membrane protein, TIGR04097 family
MDFERDDSIFPIGAVIYGSLAALFVDFILVTFAAVFTELGWTGTVTWPNNSLYLLFFFMAIVIGSVLAGWKSHQKGWAVGIGVTVITSIIWLIFALLLREKIQPGIFLVKVLLGIFIGAFGGIIGVNVFGGKG